MQRGGLHWFAAATAAWTLAVCQGASAGWQAKTTQPSINPAALKKLAEPWPEPEELAARRVAAESRPLFAATEAFPFTLAADFKTINKDRRVEGKVPYPGLMTIQVDGSPRTLHVKLQTRGHFRLRATSCSFVPLRVEFTKDEVAGTMFDGQKSLKLITHCQNDREYEQYTMREYLTYRAYNLITPHSFRARLTTVSYSQSTDHKPIATRLGMFL